MDEQDDCDRLGNEGVRACGKMALEMVAKRERGFEEGQDACSTGGVEAGSGGW